MQSIGTALVLLGAETTVTIAYVTYSLRQGLTRLPSTPSDATCSSHWLRPPCAHSRPRHRFTRLALGTALPCSVLVWAAICYRTGQLSGLPALRKR